MVRGKNESNPDERLQILVDSILKESDRGCALVAGSVLDHLIEQLLRAYFVAAPNRVDNLLQPQGVLGTFGARKELAFCLGLTSKAVDHNLGMIKGIRNHFAHNLNSATFEDEEVRSRVSSMKAISWTSMPTIVKGMSTPKARFVKSVAVVYGLLELWLGRIRKYTPPEPGGRYPEILK